MQNRTLFSFLAVAASLAMGYSAETVTSTIAFCIQDVYECPDGSFVGRDPMNGCAFFPCELVCTEDAKECPDGSFVGRDPKNGCAFFPCKLDCKICPGGFFDGCNNCTCGKKRRSPNCTKRACRPGSLQPRTCNKTKPPKVCAQDVSTCPDGSAVGRDPANGCKFFPCPTQPIGCDTCKCGYNDGCNDCQCARDGSMSCTERTCVWEGIPSCLPCSSN